MQENFPYVKEKTEVFSTTKNCIHIYAVESSDSNESVCTWYEVCKHPLALLMRMLMFKINTPGEREEKKNNLALVRWIVKGEP